MSWVMVMARKGFPCSLSLSSGLQRQHKTRLHDFNAQEFSGARRETTESNVLFDFPPLGNVHGLGHRFRKSVTDPSELSA